MPYLSSNAPLPQNSLDPPTAQEVAAANARLYQNSQASMTGRERVYADLPDVESFFNEGAGLAVDAAYIIPASELARRSVLNGLTPFGAVGSGATNNANTQGAVGPNGQPIFGQTPNVISLNAPSGQATGMSPVNSQPSMPIGAPVASQFGWMQSPESGYQAGPPACRHNPVNPLPCPKHGLAGYAPPWSDAFETMQGGAPVSASGSKTGWVVLALLGGGLFALGHAGKGRGRF